MNPTPPSLHFHSSLAPTPSSSSSSFLFSLSLSHSDLSQGVTVSYSLICVNPCFRQHDGRRATPPSNIGRPVLPPDSQTPVHWLRLVTQGDGWEVRKSWEVGEVEVEKCSLLARDSDFIQFRREMCQKPTGTQRFFLSFLFQVAMLVVGGWWVWTHFSNKDSCY